MFVEVLLAHLSLSLAAFTLSSLHSGPLRKLELSWGRECPDMVTRQRPTSCEVLPLVSLLPAVAMALVMVMAALQSFPSSALCICCFVLLVFLASLPFFFFFCPSPLLPR
mmetsp:Transcript_89021/g.195029  ORF Transcript_89021/g.195029 Transcript_89021/m.195029 type:complete len:110 (+) Transcript_89021:64-393(+)